MPKPQKQKPLLSIATIALLVFLPHYWPLPFFSYAPVLVVLMIWVLRRQNETLADIGFRFSDFSWKIIPVGLAIAVCWSAVYHFLIQPFLTHILKIQDADISAFDFIKHHIFNYVFILMMAWIIGGWYEEIVFRGFLQQKIGNLFGRNKHSFLISASITSAIFGLYHIQQGFAGIIHATLFAVITSILLYKFKGNMWYGIIFHACYDTIGLTLIYLS